MENFDVSNISDSSAEGYILECDLDYPIELHDSHSDYPLAAETMIVEDEFLSKYSKNLKTELKIRGKPMGKLIPNLRNKRNYVLHYRNLKLYLSLGMRLTKIHRGIIFTQSPWLKSYISLNTDMRKEAKNDFEKDFYKLMNNSVFGKTMENLRSRVNVELVHTEKRMNKISAKPYFKEFKIFNEDLVGADTLKTSLQLSRPTYVGFCVLDLSKTLMYNFHYDYIKEKYGEKASLLFTDTDSLCYAIETDNIYNDWERDSHLFDFSEYPTTHRLYSNKNKRALGCFKDETISIPISEFVGLRSKMYSIKYGAKEKQTAKGVSNRVVKRELKHSVYKECLFDKTCNRVSNKTIQSYKHQLFSVETKKIGLSSYDDKRYVLNCGVKTRAHGHYQNSLDCH